MSDAELRASGMRDHAKAMLITAWYCLMGWALGGAVFGFTGLLADGILSLAGVAAAKYSLSLIALSFCAVVVVVATYYAARFAASDMQILGGRWSCAAGYALVALGLMIWRLTQSVSEGQALFEALLRAVICLPIIAAFYGGDHGERVVRRRIEGAMQTEDAMENFLAALETRQRESERRT